DDGGGDQQRDDRRGEPRPASVRGSRAHAFVPVKNSTVRRKPSSNSTSGVYPKSLPARSIDASVWGTSPTRLGRCFFLMGRPSMRSSSGVISSRLVRAPPPPL